MTSACLFKRRNGAREVRPMNKHYRVRRSCYEHRAGTIARNVPNARGEVGHLIQRPHGFAANS